MSDKQERSIDPRFGQVIKMRREQMDLSLNQLEKMTGVSASYINRLEKGERKAPSYPIMKSLGTALDFNIAELLQLATVSETDNVEEICELIVKTDFSVDGTFATTPMKEKIVTLFQKIIGAKWEEDQRFIESAEMLTDIHHLQRILGKVN